MAQKNEIFVYSIYYNIIYIKKIIPQMNTKTKEKFWSFILSDNKLLFYTHLASMKNSPNICREFVILKTNTTLNLLLNALQLHRRLDYNLFPQSLSIDINF